MKSYQPDNLRRARRRERDDVVLPRSMYQDSHVLFRDVVGVVLVLAVLAALAWWTMTPDTVEFESQDLTEVGLVWPFEAERLSVVCGGATTTYHLDLGGGGATTFTAPGGSSQLPELADDLTDAERIASWAHIRSAAADACA